ncbi:MAG: hypothetical protein A2Y45_04025 [Tenericutes bacterium GWC2_34_14]|nr:MAG: hypothetical protein A2Y45_04025 [Tenericutes bacterium GWC2_34_14]OHE33240.1 MAG: hypothetical protein A2012_05805 [Tenericutes bacterium GWE2_34_108]OHE36390.1 MAG: hypothetical protein A2Y46_07910 [Tenericutes bacterium GWF1_35_14]OHE37594.1 MAG: hypothetical protein A2Y44_02835 [Tenericutes bacterium GWF2_35_184]OHE45129.1 MAG: hypothetical protein A2221_02675 [Tenericutes bacterium RIFOXYA2_FULL_36_32]OHE45894.1 MAG: hypothetical protein A3K26_00110 [Tenericutes bacterium RIFOXYA1
MKKVVAFFLLGLFVALATSFTTQAAEGDLVDLYPYNQIACLEGTNACTQTKLGDSFWDLEYAGHRYHFVKGAARFASQFNDANSSGTISAGEMGGALSWNAFAALTINNTAEEVVLVSANTRTDLTSVVHRMYSYFDETGKLQMFEDHISAYYIFNDGTPEAPDWRLATEAEKTAYDAAPTESKPVTTRATHIRMKLDATDSNGYKLEPLGYLKWSYADAAVGAPVADLSLIMEGNPDDVVIPAGWTVVSWGTNDRGTLNPATTAYIKSMPTLMLNTALAPMETIYTTQLPAFNNALGASDDDLGTPGINIVVDYNGAFTLPEGIEATYVDMFDAEGDIINTTRKINFKVEIFQDDVLLETITYTYDSGTDAYTASGAATVVDSSVFGAGYKAVYSAVNPEDATAIKSVEADIVVGVMPPKFAGVANRFADEAVYVDLMAGITADDGYGNDITDNIEVTIPQGLNIYSPKPGSYTIGLEFTHHVHFDGVQSTLDFNGTLKNWDETTSYNADRDVNSFSGNYAVWDDLTMHFRDAASAWGSVFVVVGADGKVDEIYDRYDWGYTSETENDVIKDATHFAAWQAAVQIEEGGFIVTAHGSTYAPALRALVYDSPVTLVVGYPDFDYDIVKTASYVLTVDDLTAPQALVVNHNYKIEADEFATVNQAILANIVAFDNFDSVDDLAVYVSNNGGLDFDTPAVYTVEVTVEDLAGNSTVQTFTVEVIAPKLDNDDVQDIIDEQTVSEEDVTSMLDDLETAINNNTLTPAQIQALIDAAKAAAKTETLESLPEDEVGTKLGVTIVIALGSSALSFAGAVLFLKKKI